MSYTAYEIVIAIDSNDLQLQMVDRLSDGWQPLGLPQVIEQPPSWSRQLMQVVVQGSGEGGGGSTVTADDIQDATEIGKELMTAADAAAALTAIDAIGNTQIPTATVRGGILQQTAIASLTDSSGGTSGGNTVVVVPAATAATTDTSAASLASTNAALTAVKNDISTLTAKLNAVIAAGKSAGVTA